MNRLETPCIEWDGYRDKNGYGRQSDHKRTALVHRRAWEDVHGPIPEGMLVRHKCDNPPCRNVEHLELGTHADNTQDAVVRGRFPVGEDRVHTLLTEAKVLEIRRRYVPRCRTNGTRALAREFGVAQMTVSHIVCGNTWKHAGGGHQ